MDAFDLPTSVIVSSKIQLIRRSLGRRHNFVVRWNASIDYGPELLRNNILTTFNLVKAVLECGKREALESQK